MLRLSQVRKRVERISLTRARSRMDDGEYHKTHPLPSLERVAPTVAVDGLS